MTMQDLSHERLESMMASLHLTQSEADTLIAMEKRRTDVKAYDYPDFGGKISIPLISTDQRELFSLDLARGRINLAKRKYQNRDRKVVVLVRLDVGGRPHRNPDGKQIVSSHLHQYREGFGDKWAFPVPPSRLADLNDSWQTLADFMRFCNIVKEPNIRQGLFT